jgi:hypothetical protein
VVGLEVAANYKFTVDGASHTVETWRSDGIGAGGDMNPLLARRNILPWSPPRNVSAGWSVVRRSRSGEICVVKKLPAHCSAA